MSHAVTQAFRSIARTPAFALTAVAILSIGIGATSAMVAVVDAVLLRELAYPGANRLLSLGSRMPGSELFAGRRLGLSQAQYFFIATRSRTLAEVGAYDANTVAATLTGDAEAERVSAAYASASLFSVLALPAELGRAFDADEDAPGARGTVAVLGYALWMRRFGGDRDVLGKFITVDGRRIPVVGVLAAEARLPGRSVDVWLPLGADPAAPARNHHYLATVARVRPDVSLDAVRGEMSALTREFTQAFPSVYASPRMRGSGFATDVVTLKEDVVGSARKLLWLLLAAVGLVFVVACANVANLFMVRTHSRRRESAIRAALGAGYARLARQYVLEGLIVTAVAAGAGVALAAVVLRVFVSTAPWATPRLNEVHFGASAIGFALVVSLVAGTVFGLLQLLGLAGAHSALQEEGRGSTISRRQRTLQRVFVVSQVAMAMVLLAASGTLVRTVRNLQAVDPGFDGRGVLAVEIGLPQTRAQTDEAASAAWRGLIERLSALPGVALVAATEHAPLDGPAGCSSVFVEGRSSGDPGQQPPCVHTPLVSPEYFAALGIPVRGSTFSWSETESRSAGVVVSRALARRFWPNEDPIGKGIRANGGEPPYYRVVGVVGDVRGDGLDRPPTEAVYFPLVPLPGAPLWGPPRVMTLLVRTTGTVPSTFVPAVRRTVASLEPDAPIMRIQTMDDITQSATARVRSLMAILTAAAATALLLSCVGVYSVIAYITAQRRAEIGIRLALGARSAQILRSVITQSVVLAVIGVFLGLVVTSALTDVFRSAVEQVEPNGGAVALAAALLVIGASALAGYLPARRAARLAPTEALRTGRS